MMAVRRLSNVDLLLLRRQGAMLVFCAILVVWGWTSAVAATPATDTCDNVRNHLRELQREKPFAIREANDGEVCKTSRSCCSRKVEERLAHISRIQLERNVTEAISRIANILDTKAKAFDNLFKEMLSKSKVQFHEMFKRTYGVIYMQHKNVFTDFYAELEKYYAIADTSLTDTIDKFFTIVYQKMFSVMNSQYTFDEKYMICVGEQMNELKPFGDVPIKFTTQLRRSFVATRTYGKALARGVDVVKKMMTIKLSPECANSLMKMQHCGACSGILEPKACSEFCTHVMKSCLSAHVALNNDWNNYVDAIDKVSERLLTSFNIEHVIPQIDVKISEAVMNFQDNGKDISQRVFSACGQPVFERRRRRSAEALQQQHQQTNINRDSDIHFEGGKELEDVGSLKFDNTNDNGNNKKKNKKKEKKEMTVLEKMIKETRLKVKDSFNLWQHLPYQMCNNEGISENPSETKCWNGTDIAPYSKTYDAQPHPRAITILNEQTYTLKSVVGKLKSAYQGQDVDWIDDDSDNLAGSGSGYGSGAGEDPEPPYIDGPDSDSEESSGHHGFSYPEVPVTPSLPPIYTKTNYTTSKDSPSSSSSVNKKELSIALARYLLPIVAIWLGAMFSELL